MKILIIGGGGREHAIAWKVSQSPDCGELFIAPGNAGTADLGTNIPVKAMDFEGLRKAVLEQGIEFIIVGPDDPLGAGIVDFFKNDERTKDIPILGPGASGARLESSKAFAKAFMQRHHIPTAAYRVFGAEEKQEAQDYLSSHALPIVLKADGLAAGKGVSICNTVDEALYFLHEAWDKNKFGEAGSNVVVEQFLTGIELSVFILTDGKNYILLPEAKDYKRVGDGDTGPNTGGMGSVSPVPFADKAFMQKVKERIIMPTLKGLQEENIPYNGFIFIGLIKVGEDPYVIEYNSRLGDPETQVVLPRIRTDVLPLFLEAAEGKLSKNSVEIDERYAASVIAVSGGYPETYATGKNIGGLEELEGSIVFHAGTKMGDKGLETAGGRVFAVTSLAPSLEEALDISYKNIFKVHFANMYYRNDIGKDLLEIIEEAGTKSVHK